MKNNVAESFTHITMYLIPTLIWDSQKKCNCHFIAGAQTLSKTNFQLLGWIIWVGRGHRIVFGLISENGSAWRRKSSFWETSEDTGRLGGFHLRCRPQTLAPSARDQAGRRLWNILSSKPWDFTDKGSLWDKAWVSTETPGEGLWVFQQQQYVNKGEKQLFPGRTLMTTNAMDKNQDLLPFFTHVCTTLKRGSSLPLHPLPGTK